MPSKQSTDRPRTARSFLGTGDGEKKGKEPFLIVAAGEVHCALALGEVGEVLRPLPTTPVAGAPPEVAGVAVVRGRSVPVLRLARLFEGEDERSRDPATARWVTLREPNAPVLAVDAVERVHWMGAGELDRADLLSEAAAGAVGRLGTLDRQILVCLETARIVRAAELVPPQEPPEGVASKDSP